MNKVKLGSAISVGALVVIGIIWFTIHCWSSKYDLHTSPATWYEAVGNCTRDGRRLAMIRNDTESKALYEYLRAKKVDNQFNMWIAAASFGAPSTFSDESIKLFKDVYTGEKVTYHPWFIKEDGKSDFDDSRENQYCLHVYYLTDPVLLKRCNNNTMAWGNEQCDVKLRYVCEL